MEYEDKYPNMMKNGSECRHLRCNGLDSFCRDCGAKKQIIFQTSPNLTEQDRQSDIQENTDSMGEKLEELSK